MKAEPLTVDGITYDVHVTHYEVSSIEEGPRVELSAHLADVIPFSCRVGAPADAPDVMTMLRESLTREIEEMHRFCLQMAKRLKETTQ